LGRSTSTITSTDYIKGIDMIIRCMTCGKPFRKENDIICCFEAEHQLPEVSDIPNKFSYDEETQKRFLTIFLFEMVRQGKLIHLGGGRFKPTEKFREEIKAALPSPTTDIT
jgi:hypothetical protein